MTTVTIAELEKDLAGYIAKVKDGETLELVSGGERVAEVVPLRQKGDIAVWKRPRKKIKVPGLSLSDEIIKERRESPY